jgi:hypothetical protein
MNAEALVEKAIREYTALYSTLQEVRQQFEDGARLCPDLYGETIHAPDEPLPHESWEAFIEANQEENATSAWEQWEAVPDGSYCVHYYGDEKWFERYRRLAESGLLILQGIQQLTENFASLPEARRFALPAFGGWTAWTSLINTTAVISTPFLYVEGRTWNRPEGYLGDDDELIYKCWETQPESGVSFPKHPFCIAIHHDLFRSSAEAIREWLEPDGVPTVGDCYGESPIALYSPEAMRDHIVAVQPGGANEPTPIPSLLADLAQVKYPTYEAPTSGKVNLGHYGKLSVGKTVVKEYKQPAESKGLILTKFEEAQWNRRIPNPFLGPGQGRFEKQMACQNLRRQLHELNASLALKLLKFKPVNRGTEIEWRPLAPWSDFF